MEIQQTGGVAPGDSQPDGQEARRQVGGLVEVTVRLPRRAFERLSIHQVKTAKSKAKILEELIMENLPNWVIQLRASAANPQVPTGTAEGSVNSSGENLPMGETLTSSERKRPPRRAG